MTDPRLGGFGAGPRTRLAMGLERRHSQCSGMFVAQRGAKMLPFFREAEVSRAHRARPFPSLGHCTPRALTDLGPPRKELGWPEQQLSQFRLPEVGEHGGPSAFPVGPTSFHLTHILIGPLPGVSYPHSVGRCGKCRQKDMARPQGTYTPCWGNSRDNGHHHHHSVHSHYFSPALSSANPHTAHVMYTSDLIPVKKQPVKWPIL